MCVLVRAITQGYNTQIIFVSPYLTISKREELVGEISEIEKMDSKM